MEKALIKYLPPSKVVLVTDDEGAQDAPLTEMQQGEEKTI
jgi:hypothetical protein